MEAAAPVGILLPLLGDSLLGHCWFYGVADVRILGHWRMEESKYFLFRNGENYINDYNFTRELHLVQGKTIAELFNDDMVCPIKEIIRGCHGMEGGGLF